MILEYHRPESLEEALALLQRDHPHTVPLGGGTSLSQKHKEGVAVVDLQALGLDFLRVDGAVLDVGAMVRLRALAADPNIPESLAKAIVTEYSSNLREMTTLGGAIAANDGRSAVLTALLALDVKLHWLPGGQDVILGNYLPLRKNWTGGRVIHSVQIPFHAKLAIEAVARTPGDRPILIAALAIWPSGRTRVAVGGFGAAPILVLDGPDAVGADLAASNACINASDAWASAEYRSQVVVELVQRLRETLKPN